MAHCSSSKAVLLLAVVATLGIASEALAEASGATVKLGNLHTDGDDKCINITVTNTSSSFEASVGVECTALVDEEPVETHGTAVVNLAAGEKAYDSIASTTSRSAGTLSRAVVSTRSTRAIDLNA